MKREFTSNLTPWNTTYIESKINGKLFQEFSLTLKKNLFIYLMESNYCNDNEIFFFILQEKIEKKFLLSKD